MKKLHFLSLLTFLCLVLFVSSCKDDALVSNSYILNGETISLEKAFIIDLGSNGNSHAFNVYLATNEISTSLRTFIGEGNMIQLDLNTASDTGLEEGTYNWSTSSDPLSIISSSQVYNDYNFDTGSGERSFFTDGTVDVSLNGGEATIEFTLTIAGSTVTGSYKGTLESI